MDVFIAYLIGFASGCGLLDGHAPGLLAALVIVAQAIMGVELVGLRREVGEMRGRGR